MKHLIFSTCCLLLIFLISACDSRHISTSAQTSAAAAKETARYSLQEAGIKTWKSGAKDLMDTWYVTYYQQQDKEYLVWENKFTLALEFYDWQGDSLLFSIRPDELIKGRCSMRGAYIASLDSIYILDPMDSQEYKLFLFNRSGLLLDTLKVINGGSKHIDKAMPVITTDKLPLRRGDWLHLVGLPETSCQNPLTFTEGKIDVAINLKTGEHRYGYGYPDIYSDYGSWANCLDVSRCLSPDGSSFVYSFGMEDSLRLTDHQQAEQRFYAGSDYISGEAMVAKAALSTSRSDLPDKPSAYYGGVLYDQVREVYYRMALHDLPETGVVSGWANQPISIIILNKEFEKIGETMLPPQKHLSYQWFIGPDGLYIANHYHHRQQANKRELSFTRYELQADESY